MPFDPEGLPDEVLWELSDPDFDVDTAQQDAYYAGLRGPYDNNDFDVEDFQPAQSINTLHIQKYNKTRKSSCPSTEKNSYWIEAFSKKPYKEWSIRSGKWLIFEKPEFIDLAWEQVKDATEMGLLGGRAKVSTLKGFKGTDFVICVYTYNWKDETDVMRIRDALKDLGFEKPIPYKTDADTLAGKYQHKGDKNISKYFV